jgi:hypothetical protein
MIECESESKRDRERASRRASEREREREKTYAIGGVEGLLDAVAVVDVDVHVEDPVVNLRRSSLSQTHTTE